MRRPSRRVIVATGASLLTILVAWAGWNYLRNLQYERQAGRVEVRVYVAAKPIEEGADGDLVLAQGDVVEDVTQIANLPDGAIQASWELQAFVAGKTSVESIARDTILTRAQWEAASPPGDSALLDVLWSECSFTHPSSCDLLWMIGDSAYEHYGGTCGNRNEYLDGFCVDRYGSGPDLDRWLDECSDGDGGACDLLVMFGSADSDYSEDLTRFGETCGGRIEYKGAEPTTPCFFRLGDE